MHLPLHFLTSPTLTGGSPYQVNLYSYAWLMKSRRVEEGRVNLVWRCDVRKSTAILFPTLFVRVHPPSFYSVILTGKRTSLWEVRLMAVEHPGIDPWVCIPFKEGDTISWYFLPIPTGYTPTEWEWEEVSRNPSAFYQDRQHECRRPAVFNSCLLVLFQYSHGNR